MSVSLPASVSEALLSRSSGEQQFWLLELTDTTDDATWRFASDYLEIVGPDGETYEKAAFDIQPPVQAASESPRLRGTSYIVTHEIISRVQAVAGTRNKLIGTVYAMQRGQSGAIRSYENLEMVQVLNQVISLSFELTSRRYFDRRLTKFHFGPGRFAGLF